MNADGDVSYRRYRRRILGWGAAALLVVFAIGATVSMTRVEDDLEGRVVGELDEAGLVGVRVSFSGQDGTLTCTLPLDGPDALVSLDAVAVTAAGIRGVRSVEVAAGCRVGEPPADSTADATADATADSTSDTAASGTERDTSDGDAADASASDAATSSTEPRADQSVLDLVATDPQFSALHQAIVATGPTSPAGDGPITLFAPSNDAFEALTADEAGRLNAEPELLTAILEQHIVTDELLLDEVEDGPLSTLGGSNVVVSRTPDANGDEVTLHSAGTTAAVTDADLVMSDGIVHVVDGLLVPARVRLAPVDPEVEAATRAAALQIDLDGLTDATQIGFAEAGVDVSYLSGPTLDRVAEAIVGRPGTTVVVRGHTDSGGTDLGNLFVSAARADAVLEQLVLRGVARSRLRAEGMGATDPVVVDGVEDPVASRRVDFVVETE
jgi:OOP family OmpA-OmpF porin